VENIQPGSIGQFVIAEYSRDAVPAKDPERMAARAGGECAVRATHYLAQNSLILTIWADKEDWVCIAVFQCITPLGLKEGDAAGG